VTSTEIRGGQSGTTAGYYPSFLFGFLLLTIIIPPFINIYLLLPHEACDSPDQAAHYHTLGPKLRRSTLTQYLDGH
jgi:hypothetical protein